MENEREEITDYSGFLAPCPLCNNNKHIFIEHHKSHLSIACSTCKTEVIIKNILVIDLALIHKWNKFCKKESLKNKNIIKQEVLKNLKKLI